MLISFEIVALFPLAARRDTARIAAIARELAELNTLSFPAAPLGEWG